MIGKEHRNAVAFGARSVLFLIAAIIVSAALLILFKMAASPPPATSFSTSCASSQGQQQGQVQLSSGDRCVQVIAPKDDLPKDDPPDDEPDDPEDPTGGDDDDTPQTPGQTPIEDAQTVPQPAPQRSIDSQPADDAQPKAEKKKKKRTSEKAPTNSSDPDSKEKSKKKPARPSAKARAQATPTNNHLPSAEILDRASYERRAFLVRLQCASNGGICSGTLELFSRRVEINGEVTPRKLVGRSTRFNIEPGTTKTVEVWPHRSESKRVEFKRQVRHLNKGNNLRLVAIAEFEATGSRTAHQVTVRQ